MSTSLGNERAQADLYETISPDGKTIFTLYLEDGQLFYFVTHKDKEVITTARMGIKTDKADFFDGLTFISTHTTTWSDSYSVPGRKKSEYIDNPVERTYIVAKDGHQLKVLIRAYDDGVAFRYFIAGPGGTFIRDEYTEYHLPAGTKGWGFPWINTYEQLSLLYEYEDLLTIDSLKPIAASVSNSAEQTGELLDASNLSMPFLATQNEVWALYTEANIYNANATYCPSILKSLSNTEVRFKFEPAPDQAKFGEPKSLQVALPFQTPWRVVIISEDLEVLVNSTLVQNVNPASKVEDTSWIKPGRVAWSWWSDYTFIGDETLCPNSPQKEFSLKSQKRLVDFAADMGWEYVTVDAGWVEWTDGNIADLCAYAKPKGVGIFIWVDPYMFTPYGANRMNMRLWKSWGIVGLKCDMIMNDSQDGMSFMEDVTDYCAELGLMLNLHNCTKPGGENRTWPHILASESVLGLEHHWLYWPPLPTAAHNCTLPFLRNVIGAMDYTPVGISNNNKNTSQGHQIALSVIFECALQHFADSIDVYSSWKGTEFLKVVPTAWDELKLIEGNPSDYVTMARRCGEDWYVGAITTKARTMKLQLSALNLASGEYTAYIYKDGHDADYLVKEVLVVEQNAVLEIPLLQSGGCSILISKTTVPTMPTVSGTVYEAEDAILVGGAVTVDSLNCFSGKKVGNIGNGGEVIFNVTVPETGEYPVKLHYLSQDQRSLSCSINGSEGFDLEIVYASGSWNVVRAYLLNLSLQRGENELRFYHHTWAVDIDKISIEL